MQGLPSFCLFKALTGTRFPRIRDHEGLYRPCAISILQDLFALHPGGPFVAALVLSLFIYFLVTLLSLGKYSLKIWELNSRLLI